MRRVLVLGAGPAGLAAAFELAGPDGVPDDVEIVVIEGEEHAGGRATSVASDEAELASVCPEAPLGAHIPRALWRLDDTDEHTRALLDEDERRRFGPRAEGQALWLNAPDVATPAGRGGIIVLVHAHPASSKAQEESALMAASGIDGEGWNAFRALLFDTRLTAGARWSFLHALAWAEQQAGDDGRAQVSRRLGGRALEEVEASALRAPLFEHAVAGLRAAAAVAGDSEGELARLIVADAARVEEEDFAPERSRLWLALVDGARTGPAGLDAAAALRVTGRLPCDAGARVVDGGNQARVWAEVSARLEARLLERGNARLLTGAWVCQLLQEGARVSGVELTDNAQRSAPPVPTTTAARKGIATESIDADVVISTLSPAGLGPLIRLAADERQEAFVHDLLRLGRAADERLTLALWPGFDVHLPLPTEGSPCAVRDIGGPWREVIDLSRAHSDEARRRVRTQKPEDQRVRGGGFVFTGAWADVFVDDGRGYAHGVRETLRHLAQSAEDIDLATIDERSCVRAVGPVVAAVHGEIEGLHRTAYVERWVEQVSPLLASQALRTLARLPGMAAEVAARLELEAERVVRGVHVSARWLLLRSGQLEQRASSWAPGLEALRPRAGKPTPVEGLWLAGDWTRDNGVDLPGVEAAIASGRRAAQAAIRTLR